jgi:hypothetical protein
MTVTLPLTSGTNKGTTIIGSNPFIDNPLNPFWDAEGAANEGTQTAKQGAGIISTVSNTANAVSTGVQTTFSVTNFLSQGSSWKAIGLILAGAIMLILAVVELTAGGAVRMVTQAVPR